MKRALSITVFIVALTAAVFAADAVSRHKLFYFYTLDCRRCAEIKSGVMPHIEKRFGRDVNIEYRNISDPQNYMELFDLKQKAGSGSEAVFPVLYLNGHFLDAGALTGDARPAISEFISRSMDKAPPGAGPSRVDRDILGYLKALGPLAVIAAGLVDGINPCAFTVIVFFTSFLFLQGYHRKVILVSGMAFIASVFLTYILIGAGLFGSLYALRGFWAVANGVTIFVALLSIGLGILSLFDGIRYLATKDMEGSILKLPKSIKDRIHSVLGAGYRVSDHGKGASGRKILKIVLVSLSAGFTVSILESVCTGQLYLPAIVYLLKASPHKMFAIGNLLLYNLMFVMPLIVVFMLALAGTSAQSFGMFMKRHFLLIKLAMAALFLALGAGLAFAETGNYEAQRAAARSNDPYFHDFGRAKEGEVLKYRFMLANDSQEPLNIKNINASCACATSKLDTNIVPPGKKVPIDIAFDTRGYPGMRTRYFFVHTDSSRTPVIILEIAADIIKND